MATWIGQRATPSDAIWIWGNSPELYFDLDLPLGSRFVFVTVQDTVELCNVPLASPAVRVAVKDALDPPEALP